MTTFAVGPYPPIAPTMAGTLLTVDQYLQNPLQVQRLLQDLTLQRFIADRILTQGGTATGGAVLYDQILFNDLYLTADVQAITPGSEFPVLQDVGPAQIAAKTTKWGGAVVITYEERDRDKRDVMNRQMTKLRNTIVKKVDTVALAVVRASPTLTQAASAAWSIAGTAIPKDVATAQALVDKQDMGYVLTDAYVSPTTMNNLVSNTAVSQQISYNQQGPQMVTPPSIQTPADPRLRGWLGLNWYVTNRVGDAECMLFSGQMAGSISDEKPLYTRVIDQPEKERVLIQAARLTVPYITDPKSVVRLTGI